MGDRRKESIDDFDKLIRHSDFGKVLELAGKLQDEKSKLVTFASDRDCRGISSPPSLSLRRKKNRDDGTGIHHGESEPGERPVSRRGGRESYDIRAPSENAAQLIRETLIPENSLNENSVIGRGMCMVTDSLIDETIHSLTEELRLCLDLKEKMRGMAGGAGFQMISRQQSNSPEEHFNRNNCSGRRGTTQSRANYYSDEGEEMEEKGEPIAVKFSKWQTDLLTSWMIEHREHPFPTQDEIKALAKATDLTETQIVNWTTNVRKRNLKAIVNREKKPHHFLDFLFLATDREKCVRRKSNGDAFTDVPPKTSHNTFGTRPFNTVPPKTRQPTGYENNLNASKMHWDDMNDDDVGQLNALGFNRDTKGIALPPFPIRPRTSYHNSEVGSTGREKEPNNYPLLYQPLDIHYRQTAKAPVNADQVFRGKRLSTLQEKLKTKTGNVSINNEMLSLQRDSQPQFSPLRKPRHHREANGNTQNNRFDLFELKERAAINEHVSHGIIGTPPGSFDQIDEDFLMDGIYENMFEEYLPELPDANERISTDSHLDFGRSEQYGLSKSNRHFELDETPRKRNSGSSKSKGSDVGVSGDDDMDVPFDESDEDYLMELIMANDDRNLRD